MFRYFFAVLFYPNFAFIGLIVSSFGVANENIAENISNTTVLYMLFSFVLTAWVIYILARILGPDRPENRAPSIVSVGHLYIIFAGLVLISCLPLIAYGVPIFIGMNRYTFLSLDFVAELRQLDTAITWVFVSCLVTRLTTSQRNAMWMILIVLAFLYGEKFSPLVRIIFFELIIRLYWKENLYDRSAVILSIVLGVVLVVSMSIYWWTGTISDVLKNVIARAGKQASCTIAVTDRLGFLQENIGTFWNFFEVKSKGVSFFHEVSRAVSLREDHSILGDSFPCVYMAMSPNIFVMSGLLITFTAIKILLLKFMFFFLDNARLGVLSTVVVFLYVRHLDSMLASDRFHLLTHPVFLASAYFMLITLVAKWHRQVAP